MAPFGCNAFTLTEAQDILKETECEITQLEQRMGVSHGLGDTGTATGVSASFIDNKGWRIQLGRLRSRKRFFCKLVDFLSGKSPMPPRTPGINIAVHSGQ